jgi:hypothetical protein
VNNCFVDVGTKKREIAAATANTYYVQNFGLMQSIYQIPAGAAAPGRYPNYFPYPGGFGGFPMPDASFDAFNLGGFIIPGDGIHPSEASHKAFLRNAVEQFYINWYPPTTRRRRRRRRRG